MTNKKDKPSFFRKFAPGRVTDKNDKQTFYKAIKKVEYMEGTLKYRKLIKLELEK